MKVLSSFHRITTSRQIIAIAIFSLGLNACYNEPGILGGNLIPSGDKSSVQVTDTFKVAAYTVKTDTFITSATTDVNNVLKDYGVLGSHNDKIFGGIKAEFYTRIVQSNTKDTLKKITPRPDHADSVVLYLKLVKTWGEKKAKINVRVYQLVNTDSINGKTVYNGIDNPNLNYYPVQVNVPTVYSGEEKLKIKFTQAFADTLMKADTSILSSQVKFMRYMRGLYFTIDTNTDPNVLYSFNLNAEVVMHYMKPTPNGLRKATYRYIFGYLEFNHFQRDNTNADIRLLSRSLSSIDDNTPEDTIFAIDGLGGARGLIKLKGVKEWKKLMPMAIHRAELRFDKQDNVLPKDSSSQRLYFYNYRESSIEKMKVTDNYIYDSKIAEVVPLVKYNQAKKYYSIDVTIQLQNLLRGEISKDYIIVENENYKNTYMQGLFRTGNNSKPIKLIVTYSKL